jgi:hypothetical protein
MENNSSTLYEYDPLYAFLTSLKTIFISIVDDILDWIPSWNTNVPALPQKVEDVTPWVSFFVMKIQELLSILTKDGRTIYVGIIFFIFAAVIGSL